MKKKIKSEDYKNCLEAVQLENKIKQLEKSRVDIGSFRQNHKELIK